MFEDIVLEILTNAGWSTIRKNSHFLNDILYLEIHNFIISESIRDFIESFGGLRLQSIKKRSFHFNVFTAVNGVDPSWVLDEYSSRVDKPLVIIGEAYNRQMVLCADDNLCMYYGIDDDLWKVGNTLVESVSNLCIENVCEKIE